MRIGDMVDFDGVHVGTVCRIFPEGSLDICEVIAKLERGEDAILTLRRLGDHFVSTEKVCRSIPSDYRGMTSGLA